MLIKVKNRTRSRNAKIYLEENPKIAAEIEMAIREKAGVIAKKLREIHLIQKKLQKIK